MIASIPTVLYVDDNTKSRRLLGSVLRDCGVEVITTADPAGCATQKCRSSRPSCFPIVLKTTAEAAATEGDDGIGAANAPEHA
jgi:CheY-like chemotaxis protein